MTVAARFDELIHPSTRLSIVAILATADWVDFPFVRDRLGLSDSALSKQLATLDEAGYVTIERPVTERRRRVRVRLSPPGAERSTGTSPPCGRLLPLPIRRGRRSKAQSTGGQGAITRRLLRRPPYPGLGPPRPGLPGALRLAGAPPEGACTCLESGRGPGPVSPGPPSPTAAGLALWTHEMTRTGRVGRRASRLPCAGTDP